MQPRIAKEFVEDPLGFAEHTLGTTASKKYNEVKKTGNVCISWKSNKYYIFWVCVRSLKVSNMQSACAVLSSVACLTVQYSSTLPQKRHDFWKTFIEHKMCVLIFSTTYVWNISYSKWNSSIYYHKCTSVFMPSIRYSFQSLMKLEFSRQIF